MGLWSSHGPKTKRNVLLICTFILGMVGLMAGINYSKPGIGHERPSINPMGCIPFTKYACPAMMECIVDFEFAPYYGRCICDIRRAQLTRPPVFDDRELDDPWAKGDYCRADWVVSLLHTLATFPVLFSLTIFGKIAIETMWSLVKQNDKFKWNSTTRGLVVLYTSYFWGVVPAHFGWLLSEWGLDKYSLFFDYGTALSIEILNFSYNLGSYELTCSWFDLVQRTVKMSRTSSRWMTGIKWFLRTFNLVWNGILTLVIKLPDDKQLLYYTWAMVFHMVINLVPGIILTRMLCKDRKDVTNPNWKAGQVIRRTTIINLQAQCLGLLSFQVQFKSLYPGYFTRGTAFYYAYLWLSYACVMQAWGWMHYILFGCRKLLNSSESDKISQYFGFTTIGLNSTLVSGISRVSSVASSVASMVSTASVAEKDDGDDDERK